LKNVPQVEKCAALGKMCHTSKNVLNLKNCATVKKKSASLGKLRHRWKIVPNSGISPHSRKNVRHLEKCETLVNMHYTWKQVPHLEKCAALGKIICNT